MDDVLQSIITGASTKRKKIRSYKNIQITFLWLMPLFPLLYLFSISFFVNATRAYKHEIGIEESTHTVISCDVSYMTHFVVIENFNFLRYTLMRKMFSLFIHSLHIYIAWIFLQIKLFKCNKYVNSKWCVKNRDKIFTKSNYTQLLYISFQLYRNI